MLADSDWSSLVPETSRYTLEELHEVFRQDTRKIVKTGWYQLKWLITGVGVKRGYHGRWVRSEYPRLVPHATFRGKEELQDRGGVASGSEIPNGGVSHGSAGITSRRPINTPSLGV